MRYALIIHSYKRDRHLLQVYTSVGKIEPQKSFGINGRVRAKTCVGDGRDILCLGVNAGRPVAGTINNRGKPPVAEPGPPDLFDRRTPADDPKGRPSERHRWDNLRKSGADGINAKDTARGIPAHGQLHRSTAD